MMLDRKLYRPIGHSLLTAIAAMILLAGSLPSRADPQADYEQGVAALTRSDMNVTIEKLESAGSAGHIEAMVLLAHVYEGAGFAELAYRWFLKAANAGNGEAAYRVYLAHLFGRGAQKNKEKSIEWLNFAADRKNPEALMTLVDAYGNGKMGFKQDNKKALSYLAQAAKHKHSEAIYELSNAYQTGKYGLEPDPAKAKVWLQKAQELDEEIKKGNLKKEEGSD